MKLDRTASDKEIKEFFDTFDIKGIPVKMDIVEYFTTGHDDTAIRISLFDKKGRIVFEKKFVDITGIDWIDEEFFAFRFADYICEKYDVAVESSLIGETYTPPKTFSRENDNAIIT